MIDISERLTAFFTARLPAASTVRIEGLDTQQFGYSAEMLMLTVVIASDAGEERLDLVVRQRPVEPGLLEPYDLQQQYDVLRALHDTDVVAPPVHWVDPTGAVLGRAFLVMGRVEGTAYEMDFPAEIEAVDGRVRRMCESLVEALAVVHAVDAEAAGLTEVLGDGTDYLEREIERWHDETLRVQRGPMPALERLYSELKATLPTPTRTALLHGDAKPGNFGFTDGEVTTVFDWELAAVGDPLADIGYLEALWTPPVAVGLPSRPGAFTPDELIAHYETATGTVVHHREWYRALGSYKIAVLSLMAAMLYEHGHSEDPRLVMSALGVPMLAVAGLTSLGVTETVDDGPYLVSDERLAEMGTDLDSILQQLYS